MAGSRAASRRSDAASHGEVVVEPFWMEPPEPARAPEERILLAADLLRLAACRVEDGRDVSHVLARVRELLGAAA